LNYSGFKSDLKALRAEVDLADEEVCRQAQGSVLAIADLSDTTAAAAAVELFKQSATRTKPFIHKLALVGIHGLNAFSPKWSHACRVGRCDCSTRRGAKADGGVAIGSAIK